MSERISWDDYFAKIADITAERSTCRRRRVGAVIVKNNHILATGYNGAPKGCLHCTDIGCLREDLGIPSGQRHEICRGAHAEMNAISQCAALGVATEGAAVYCNTKPCSICAKIIINAGIKEVYYRNHYDDKLTDDLFSGAGIILHLMDKTEEN